MLPPGADNRNLLLAFLLSTLILLGWQLLYAQPKQEEITRWKKANPEKVITSSGAAIPAKTEPVALATRAQAIQEGGGRVKLESDFLHGSIDLKGARIDDLTLARYKETIDSGSPDVVLLSPSNTKEAYFAEFGWTGEGALPDRNTVWKADKSTLKAGDTVTLSWNNGQGLTFRIRLSLDERYLFTAAQSVENHTQKPVSLSSYGLLSRNWVQTGSTNAILHEGPMGAVNNELVEERYKDIKEKGNREYKDSVDWVGITDKYWLTALIPGERTGSSRFQYYAHGGLERYQTDILTPKVEIAPGESANTKTQLFAGPKEVRLLLGYAESLNVPLFDRAVDFGVLYFLTKPMFFALDFLYSLFGNFGIAILALTVLVKLLLFPMAQKSYISMNQMKLLQPEMMKLRERFKDDKQKFNQELMALYRREKVNPAAGCLPLLIQIPIFFALYKVLFVSIEMRHAPFFGWIKDLSAPDPLWITNLFGVLPFTPPHLLQIGIWPIIMMLTMIVQQQLNPKPTDPVQEKVLKLLPYFFLFLFGTFPAGLVIYWSWSNLLSILQQWAIKRQVEGKSSRS